MHLVETLSGCKMIAGGSLVVAVSTACRFLIYKERKTWEEANQTCTQRGMQLATIPDYEFDASLYNTSCARWTEELGILEYWIGAQVNKTYNSTLGRFHWFHGTGDECLVTGIKEFERQCFDIQPGQCAYVKIPEQEDVHNLQLKKNNACNASRGYICESLPAKGE